jgi:hypothetical protein
MHYWIGAVVTQTDRDELSLHLAPGGRILLADPFRGMAIRLLESLERAGWAVGMTRYDLGEDMCRRSVGVFELKPPRVLSKQPQDRLITESPVMPDRH